MKRVAMIESSCVIRINTGNYEHVEIMKRIALEIEFESAEEFDRKSLAHDKKLISMVKAETEAHMASMGRKRHTKAGNLELEVGLWNQFDDVRTPDPDAIV